MRYDSKALPNKSVSFKPIFSFRIPFKGLSPTKGNVRWLMFLTGLLHERKDT